MEDVLAVYTRSHDPDSGLDESSTQLLAETRVSLPMKAGRPARFDYEYEFNGTANLFIMFAPLEGWRHVKVTDRHTAVDYAHVLKDLAHVHFASAKQIVLVQDDLNIPAGLHSSKPSLPPKPRGWSNASKETTLQNTQLARSGRIRIRRSIVPVPRPLHSRQTLIDEIAAWEHDRNAHHTEAKWHITTPDARIKFKHLHPSI
jgi:hypothetical protein